MTFFPRLEILPEAQRKIWTNLAEVPRHFVLYGVTGLALRLGHRTSVDFDFFSSEPVIPETLLDNLALLKNAKVLQLSAQTLTVLVNLESPVKLSFFGGLTLGRVGVPEQTADGVMHVASLLDIAGTKAAVVYLRAESKDYLDILALTEAGMSLSVLMAAARALYGERYNPILTAKALSHFSGGDLAQLTPNQRDQLAGLVSQQSFRLEEMARISDRLSPG